MPADAAPQAVEIINRERLEEAVNASHLPADPMVPVAVSGVDQSTGGAASSSAGGAAAAAPSSGKRKAEDPPDDPRADSGEGAEVVQDDARGQKRTAEAEADDSARGDVDSVETIECEHCGVRCGSRNLLFKHLYQHHDEDGEGL